MSVLLMIVALAALGFGLLQHLKGKRILAAPFKKTGEIAEDPISSDPRGMMSTHGAVVPPKVQVLSALSKTPCLYYEVVITRKWEKQQRTRDGYKTVKGSSTVQTVRDGAVFGLDDGSGVILVDASKGGDFDNLKKLGKPGWRSMAFSSKGRDGLVASTAKMKIVSFISGGACALAAVALMILAPAAIVGVHSTSVTDAPPALAAKKVAAAPKARANEQQQAK